METVFSPWHAGRTEDELIEVFREMDGAIVASDRLTARVIRAANHLKVISRTGVGYDEIDVKAATERGIAVCNTPGVNRHAVADLTLAFILCCARKLAQNLAEIRRGKWKRHEGIDLMGKTLGIVGLGTIGKEVARRAHAFGMRILACDPVQDFPFAEAHGITYAPLEDLLRQADFVSLHLFLNDTSRHLIHHERLALMKPTAFLINTARGGLVDTVALCQALMEKRIAGAALDVIEEEPLYTENPLLKFENVYLSPHVGGTTADARNLSGTMAADNLISALKGKRPQGIVNPVVLSR